VVAGIFTDPCMSSTVRSLTDERFGVVVEDCCAAAPLELHRHELFHVVSRRPFAPLPRARSLRYPGKVLMPG